MMLGQVKRDGAWLASTRVEHGMGEVWARSEFDGALYYMGQYIKYDKVALHVDTL